MRARSPVEKPLAERAAEWAALTGEERADARRRADTYERSRGTWRGLVRRPPKWPRHEIAAIDYLRRQNLERAARGSTTQPPPAAEQAPTPAPPEPRRERHRIETAEEWASLRQSVEEETKSHFDRRQSVELEEVESLRGRCGLRVSILVFEPRLGERFSGRWAWTSGLPIGGYTHDFVCASAWVTSEADGHHHWLCIGMDDGDRGNAHSLAHLAFDRMAKAPRGPRNRIFDEAWAARMAVWFGYRWSSIVDHLEVVVDRHEDLLTNLIWRKAMIVDPIKSPGQLARERRLADPPLEDPYVQARLDCGDAERVLGPTMPYRLRRMPGSFESGRRR